MAAVTVHSDFGAQENKVFQCFHFFPIGNPLQYSWASMVAQLVKNPPAMWETWVQSMGWEDPLEKGKATHSSFWPGESHGRRNLVGYSPRGHRVGHDWATSLICHEVGLNAMILVFWTLNFRSAFSTFIKRLFSSSSLSTIRVVSSAYLRYIDISPSNLDSTLWEKMAPYTQEKQSDVSVF